jgi:HSP20 family molecular chaperone IbpA
MSDEYSPRRKPGPTEPHHADQTGGSISQRWVIVRHTTVWHPPTDVYEQGDSLIVVVEIAGMHDSDFSVVLQGQRLIIGGARGRIAPADSAYHQLEIPFGEFRAEVDLPWTVLRDSVTASYRDGFLRVELPRALDYQDQDIDQDSRIEPS